MSINLDFFKVQNESFPGQQADEKIHLIFRQHWLVVTWRFLVWVLFIAILIIGDQLIVKYIPQVKQQPFVGYYDLFRTLYLMFSMLGLLIIWVMYYLNYQIITNERIVDIDQTSLLHHRISELHLSKIEDVTAENKGIFQTFFDYGNVFIQTAGETERFEFLRVPRPTYISKMIMDLYEQLPESEKIKK
jgi:hypothetical protein